jgi:hypothetical protein
MACITAWIGRKINAIETEREGGGKVAHERES